MKKIVKWIHAAPKGWTAVKSADLKRLIIIEEKAQVVVTEYGQYWPDYGSRGELKKVLRFAALKAAVEEDDDAV